MDPVSRLNAALEGRYHIERKLGEGGMATVYLATDLRHNRKVALKVLKPDLAAALGADRFLAEVSTTANLQHPHILPLARAAELADRALALDADSHLAIFVRGLVACTRGRPEEGLVDLYRAHELRHGDVNVLLEMNRFSVAAGLQHSERNVKRLVEVDPLSPQAHLMIAMHSYYTMHAPGGPVAASAHRAIQLSPDASMLHTHAAWLIGASGLRAEAVAVLDRVRSHTSAQLAALASFLSCALEGDEDGALRSTTHETEQTISNEFLYLIMAQAYARLGRSDDALRMLRAAVRLGLISYPCLTTNATLVQCLKANPGYEALLCEIKPRWERVVDWERGLVS